MRKVFLDDLPRKEGIGANKNKQIIDWKESVGKSVYFIYLDLTGELKIIDYDGRYLYIKYKDKETYKIFCSSFEKSQIGGILRVITNDFKIEINTIIKDNKNDIVIINKEYRKYKNNINLKWYKYKCNICGYESWIEESNLLKGIGCTCCSGKTLVLGKNTIYDKQKWMITFTGEDIAKKYMPNSNKKIEIHCPECNAIKNTTLNNLYTNGFSCNVCSDKISYPEKVMIGLLKELGIKFIPQLSKTNFAWCKDKRYDFYIYNVDENGKNGIIECHGMQHYEEGFHTFQGGRTLEEEKENDEMKERLAKENKVDNYIIIDCRYSDLEYIKNNILSSKLLFLFPHIFRNIDWRKIEEFACSSLVKLTCEIKRDNPDMVATEIGEIIGVGKLTVRKYLKQGSIIWDWINYNPKEEQRKNARKVGKQTGKIIGKKYGKLNGKKVEIFKNGISLGKFESCSELSRQSEELFGVKFTISKIAEVCNNKLLHHKRYTFRYI